MAYIMMEGTVYSLASEQAEMLIIIIIIIIVIIVHHSLLSWVSSPLEPMVHPTTQASNFRL
jgi:uncharacterized protein YpmB